MDKKETKINILNDCLGKGTKSGGEVLYSCPRCNHHKKKLSVNISKGVYKCWVCGFSGRSLRQIIKKSGNMGLLGEWDNIVGYVDMVDDDDFAKLFNPQETIESAPVIPLPEDYRTLATPSEDVATMEPKRYLFGRGLSYFDIAMWKIGFCPSGDLAGRIMIPSFNLDGDVNYYVTRNYKSEYKKYINSQSRKENIIFNHLMLDFKRPMVLVEGVFDAIRTGLSNVVPLLGSTLAEDSKLYYELIKNNTEIRIALDPDAWKKEIKIMQQLLKYNMDVFKINVAGYKDVGEMPREEFGKRNAQAEKITQDNLILYKMLMCS